MFFFLFNEQILMVYSNTICGQLETIDGNMYLNMSFKVEQRDFLHVYFTAMFKVKPKFDVETKVNTNNV